MPVIASAASYTTDKAAACWFPSEGVARVWQAFVVDKPLVQITEASPQGDKKRCSSTFPNRHPMKILVLLSRLLAVTPSLRAKDAAASYTVTSAFSKYVTADIEFRNPTGAKWPNFLYGKPANDAGVIDLSPANPAASFALHCDRMAQDHGDQSRRVLGELCAPDPLTPLRRSLLWPFPVRRFGKQMLPEQTPF